ncbi:S8 family peptidase [Streptomyces cellulosae]|uniref:S8 family peptidase n=1 Tax=Streptomyces cellulosae TaxID=1968 RepID=UPI0004CB75E7|nr:S8 family peptidase [Streptomyces cellulosae]
MRIESSSAALAALLVAGVMTGVSVADTGTGLGLRTADADTAPASDAGRDMRTVAGSTAAGAGAGSSARFITLITGDRVQLDARGRVTGVQQAPGREGVPVSVRSLGGEQYVVPADAAARIGQGTLDKRLFDVSALIRAGYDDARRATLPLIVSYDGKGARRTDTQKSLVADADVTVRRELPSVSGAALTVPKAEAEDAWQVLTSTPGVARVWLDGRLAARAAQGEASDNVTQIGAPGAWAAGYDGKGVKVAVLDTGVDTTHPDLASVVTESKDFSGTGSTDDRVGHGTHVAATVAGSGARSGGLYRGVAPGAEILSAKVLNDSGEGSSSSVIAGLEWAAARGAKVANLSLGHTDTPGNDPVETAVNALSKSTGMLTVAAAGNDGPRPMTLSSPSTADSALAVGAVDDKDRIADFSSTGPTADSALKPDLTAPGVDIVSAKAAHGELGDPAADGYVSMSGTSMATPHVAGAAAILAQRHPDWTGERIKQALTASAAPTAGLTGYQQGTGRVSVPRALTQTVVSEQTSVSFGEQRWPHSDDQPLARRVTYRNDGDGPVTLDLAATAAGPAGQPAPEGMFRLSASQITVPAGGTASVDLTADTRTEAADGAYSGAIIATEESAGTAVRTAFGVIREAEAYDLTLKFLDRRGKPVSSPLTEIFDHSSDYWTTELGDSQQIAKGVYKVRVPRGDYVIDTVMSEAEGGGGAEGTTALVRPNFSLTKNTTVTFDARKAKPVEINAPKGGGKMRAGSLNFGMGTGNDAHNTSLRGAFTNLRTATLGPAAAPGKLSTQISGLWQKGGTTYNLLYNLPDHFPTGYRHTARMSELALLNRHFGSSVAHRKGIVNALWRGPTLALGTVSAPFPLPATAKTYVTTPKGFRWTVGLGQQNASGDEADVFYYDERPVSYRAGRTYESTYNVGVFSPLVGGAYGARRSGDTLDLCIPDLADGAGHPASSVAARHTTVTAGGRTLLDDDGDLCQTVDKLPAGPARYTIRTDLTRPATVAGTTSRLTAAWTFTSKHTSPHPDTPTLLPLSTVRFHPTLTLTGTAASGRRVTVPLSIEGPAAKHLKSLVVKVSYDAGATWSAAGVTTDHGKKTLAVTHPAKARSVSFKTTLTDTEGNTYSATILRAYLLT